MIGVYIVDCVGNGSGNLLDRGNRGDNIRHTLVAESGTWLPDTYVYWKEDGTPVDIYGYYPYDTPTNVRDYSFSVMADQSITYSDDRMGAFEASDFLWGKVDR